MILVNTEPVNRDHGRIYRTLRSNLKIALIIGPPRSGTTMLASLLAADPTQLSLSEPLLAHAILPAWRQKHFLRRIAREGRLPVAVTPTQPSESEFLRWIVERAAQAGCESLVIKETFRGAMPWTAWNNAAQMERLASGEIARAVSRGSKRGGTASEELRFSPDWPRLAIIRHPYAVAASTVKLCRALLSFGGLLGRLMRLRWSVIPALRDADEVVLAAARNWAAYAEWLGAVTASGAGWQSAAGWPVIRYEDLVALPQEKLGWVCERLGLQFDSRMLEPRKGIRRRVVGIGDNEVLRGRPRAVDLSAVSRGSQLTDRQRAVVREWCQSGANLHDYELFH